MRPILAAVLFVGCTWGDNLSPEDVDPRGDLAGGDRADDGGAGSTTRYQPSLCAVESYAGVDVGAASRDVGLAVVATPQGTAVFSVPKAGGPVRGYTIDHRGALVGEERGVELRADAKYTAISATMIDERLVTAAIADDEVVVDMWRNDLGAKFELGRVKGNQIANLPMLPSRGGRVATIGDGDGLVAVSFDNGWQLGDVEHVSAAVPLSLSATALLDDALIVWSTADSCTVRRHLAGVEATRPRPCLGVRVALDPATRRTLLAYEDDGQIVVSDLYAGGHGDLHTDRKLAVGTAPRVVFDGSHFWVSYINERNDVVVGFVAEDGSLRSMALEGTQPDASGYELAVIGGTAWVFAVDASGHNAQRMCIKSVRY